MPLHRSLAETLADFGDVLKNEIKCAIPATVTAVHPDRQTVDVQIGINNPINDDLGNIFSEPAPSISDVPLGVMRGGGFFVWVPVAVGDFVLLVISDLSVDGWRSASNGTPQEAIFVGKHTLDSPFAIPMIAPDPHFFADPNAAPGKVIIGKDGSAAQIRISATDIELGNNATDALGLASKIDGAVSAIISAFNSHTHVAPSGGGTTTGPTPTISSQPTTASSLVKAQ